jgi:DUF4097 and DUF4098 domain-containing protein YvlB
MQKYATPTAIAAVLDIPAGRVRFVAAERVDTTVEVRAADASKSRDAKAAERTAVTFLDGVLRIAQADGKRFAGPSGSVEITVHLPAGSGVEAKAASTEFHGVGRFGEVAIEAAQGRIELDEVAGARLAVQSGDVSVGRLAGSAEISTQQGGIRIAEAARGTLVLRTRAGDIAVGAARGTSATLDAGTPHGRIRNTLAGTAGAEAELRIHASTAQGDITAAGN